MRYDLRVYQGISTDCAASRISRCPWRPIKRSSCGKYHVSPMKHPNVGALFGRMGLSAWGHPWSERSGLF